MMMVIGAGKPKKETEDTEAMPKKEGPSLSDMAEKKAAMGVLSAIESSDPAALSKALKAHYDACYGTE